jgi:hypothetical protein
MGDARVGRAVGKQTARAVGSSVGTGGTSGQVLAFTEKRLLAEFQRVDWEQREIAVYGVLHALKATRGREPEDSREWQAKFSNICLQAYL